MANDNSEGVLIGNDVIRLHFTYEDNLSLSDLSECISLVNKAINDINREHGLTNFTVGREYSSKIDSVESGSIVINVLTNFIVPVALSVLANAIYDRLKTWGQRKNKDGIISQSKYPININTNVNVNITEINIHINN